MQSGQQAFFMEPIRDLLYNLFGIETNTSDLKDEEMEEYRMTSGFRVKEIARLRRVFLETTDNEEELVKEKFLNMSCIVNNPLKEQIAMCFGYNEYLSLDFATFLEGVAAFNSIGRVNQKVKLAFKLQDFDGDNRLSRSDIKEYINRITDNKFMVGGNPTEELDKLVGHVMGEICPNQEYITLADFQRVVVKTDFQSRLQLHFE